MGSGFALLPQVQLDSMEQACADALVLSSSLDIEPVEPHFGGTGDGVVANTADYPVMLVDRQSEHIAGVNVVLVNIQQILVQTGDSAQGIFGFQHHKDHVIPVCLIIRNDPVVGIFQYKVRVGFLSLHKA